MGRGGSDLGTAARYIGGRALQGLVVVFGAVVISFALTSLIGNPADVLRGSGFTTPESLATLKDALGYDVPAPERFARYVERLLHGDFGASYRTGESAAGLVMAALPYTLMLVGGAMLLASLVAFPAALLSVLRRDSTADRTVRRSLIVAQGVPEFWLALVLMLVFAVWLQVLPTVGYRGLESAVLPTIALAVPFTSTLLRLVRAQLLDVMDLDFVTTLRAKGLSDARIVMTHGLHNALPQVVTFLALQTGYLISGTIVIEAVFGWPGMGSLLLEAVSARDVVVVQAVVIFVGLCFVALNLAADLLVMALDPRIRTGRR